jgi:hypothetical protein
VTACRTTSVFAGFRFTLEVISPAVRWFLRYGLSYRDVEELLVERGITVDHVSVYRWAPLGARVPAEAKARLGDAGLKRHRSTDPRRRSCLRAESPPQPLLLAHVREHQADLDGQPRTLKAHTPQERIWPHTAVHTRPSVADAGHRHLLVPRWCVSDDSRAPPFGWVGPASRRVAAAVEGLSD